jgi:hypothetical protein
MHMLRGTELREGTSEANESKFTFLEHFDLLLRSELGQDGVE